MIPNLEYLVVETKDQYPRAWSKCHRRGDPEAHDFIILAARKMFDVNPLFGLNGKRGSDDLSWDAVNWKGNSTDGPNVIDVVARAGETDPNKPQPAPMWGVTDTQGKYFNPYDFQTHFDYGGIVTPPNPNPTPNPGPNPEPPDDVLETLHEIRESLINGFEVMAKNQETMISILQSMESQNVLNADKLDQQIRHFENIGKQLLDMREYMSKGRFRVGF